MTYVDTLDPLKVEATLISKGAALMERWHTDDSRFALWLQLCDQYSRRRIGLSIDDMEDYTWRDEYDAGSTPVAAVTEMLDYVGVTF